MKKHTAIIESIPGQVEEYTASVAVYDYYNKTKGRGIRVNGIHSFKRILLVNEGIDITDGEILLMHIFNKVLIYTVPNANGETDIVRVSFMEKEAKRYIFHDKGRKSVTQGLTIEELMG